MALTSIGSIYFSRGENQKALQFYERALALQQALNIRNSVESTQID
jgi:tetratricopeptide (TPR) repeat protein